MEHREGTFTGVRDASIYHQAWLPDGTPRAALLIVHGAFEHSGRYASVVEHLVPRGYALYGFDLPGHGRSEGTRAHVHRFTDYTETLHTYLGLVRGWQPRVPVFVLGHSMGCPIAVSYLVDHPAVCAGIVFSGTSAQVPEGTSPLTIWAGKVLSWLAPKTRLVGIEAEGISRDPAVVQAYVDDPLVYRGAFTARTGVELLKVLGRMIDEASSIALPALLVHGELDRLAPLAGARAFYGALGSTDKTLKVYDGLYHEVFNEPERDRVLGDIASWLQAHI